MTIGIATFMPGMLPNITPDGAGGVFVGVYSYPPSCGVVRTTFTALYGMQIAVFIAMGGSHTWTNGIDGNGYPYLEATSLNHSTEYGNYATDLMVFAK